MDQQGQQVACCSWEMDAWVAPFTTFNGVVLLWTIFLVVCTPSAAPALLWLSLFLLTPSNACEAVPYDMLHACCTKQCKVHVVLAVVRLSLQLPGPCCLSHQVARLRVQQPNLVCMRRARCACS